MNTALLESVQAAQGALDPQFKALRVATGALNQAVKLAAEERADALAMQKSLAKLQAAAEQVTDPAFTQAVADFAAVTRQALDDLAFHFAHDLKEVFEQRGETVTGRPPTLVVGELVLQIDINARKAQWFYGKEALTKPIPLSINGIIKAYDQQRKSIVDRKIDVTGFLTELHTAWNELLAKRSQRPVRRTHQPDRTLQPGGHEPPDPPLLECPFPQHLQGLRARPLRAGSGPGPRRPRPHRGWQNLCVCSWA